MDNSYGGSTGKKMPNNAQVLTERDGLYISLNISFSGEPLFIIKNNIKKNSKKIINPNSKELHRRDTQKMYTL